MWVSSRLPVPDSLNLPGMCAHDLLSETFQKIWGVEGLLSSFDGFNVFLPWHHAGDGFEGLEGSKTQSGWLHCDQGAAKHGLHTIQSFVALTDHDASTGGLQVIPRSHHCHEDWVATEFAKMPDRDFCMVDPHGKGGALLRLPQKLVTCKAGDIVLWDSRTVHCSTPALEQPTTPEGELLRVAAYVCMMPKSLASKQNLECRKNAYLHGLSSNHWPLFSEEEYSMFMGGSDPFFKAKKLEDCDDGRQSLIC